MRRARPFDIPAEILLAAVTVTTVLSFGRLFVDNSWFAPLITTTVLAHLAAAIGRRLPGGLAVTVLLSGLAVVVQLSLQYFSDTTVFGVPTGTTLSAMRDALRDGWVTFQEVTPPAPVETGFVIAAAVGIWILVVLADWAAFRLRSSGEAMLPALGGLVFVTFFGRTAGSLRDALLFLTAAILFLLAHRASDRVSRGTWLGNANTPAYRSLVIGGAAIGILAIVAGAVVGPRLPGAEDEGVIDWRQQGVRADAARTVISPLVDIKGRLVDQADIEVFTVRTSQPSYYRLTALDSFDGQSWTSKADYGDAGTQLPSSFPLGIAEGDINTVQQEFNITGLGQVWLPAANLPTALQPPEDVSVNYEPESGTLIVGASRSSSDSLNYVVQSQIPRFTESNLQTGASADIDTKYLELPDDYSPIARQLAQEIVANEPTQLQRALALQDWFQSNFDYSLEIPKGHSNSAIENFLEVRAGYCEQFSGTFASMARAVGLPSRVAVGFTHGIQDPADPDLYHVRGEHAHAWPEVFIAGAGWVLFEPTPGRGAPGTEQYTGLAAAQEVSDIPLETEEDLGSEAAGLNQDLAQEDLLNPDEALQDLLEEQETEELATDETSASDGFAISRSVLYVLAAIIGVLALLFALPVLKRRRRSGQLRNAQDNRARIQTMWKHTTNDARAVGVPRTNGETDTEFANRVSDVLNLDSDDMTLLGEAVTLATYGADLPDDAIVGEVEERSERIHRELIGRLKPFDRTKYELDPRPLVKR